VYLLVLEGGGGGKSLYLIYLGNVGGFFDSVIVIEVCMIEKSCLDVVEI
jgi:hypothetical protein